MLAEPDAATRSAPTAVAMRLEQTSAARTPSVSAAPALEGEAGERSATRAASELAEDDGPGNESAAPAAGESGFGTEPGVGAEPGLSAGLGADPFAAPGVRDATLAYRSAVSRSVARALRYPRPARRAGTQGTAVVWVRLDRKGTLAHVALSEGSGSERLDEDALRTVARAAPFAAAPDTLPDAALEFDIPVQYALDR